MAVTVIKRNGEKVALDITKISNAMAKAFIDVDGEIKDGSKKIIGRTSAEIAASKKKELSVEEIQDMVVNKLMASTRKDVAAKYVEYRHERKLLRESNTTDRTVMELLNGESEYWNSENSNKNAKWVTTQRDYLAGITSTDFARRLIFPKDVIASHDKGRIHIHDMDYAAQRTLTNCCLINLEDMLQNGTVINGVTIDKPHRFITATTIASQIISAVASSQYGGTSISVTALAPFIRDSYNGYYNKYIRWGIEDEKAKKFAEADTKKEVADGVQTLCYQLNSLTTTNGQSPFVTLFMYLGETDEYKDELALLIEEILKQRIVGMKNKKGVCVAPAFPKLVYVLEEDNIHEDSPYWYLTRIAAECSAKRLVPDYVSEKVMKSLKVDANGEGHCYTPMGK